MREREKLNEFIVQALHCSQLNQMCVKPEIFSNQFKRILIEKQKKKRKYAWIYFERIKQESYSYLSLGAH